MPYHFNPHRHVKIWLSKNRDSFLNIENQLRLIRMRELNPKDRIHFIYDKRLLNENTLAELKKFCKKYRIIRKDIPKHIIPNCQTKQEKQLIIDYQKEIENLQGSGNPAAASDILRWLSPVYNLGTYTDFDVKVDTRKLSETISVKQPLLMNIGSLTLMYNNETIVLNNDVIAIVDEEAALPDIQKIQEAIHRNYSLQYNVFFNYQEQLKTRLCQVFSYFEARLKLSNDLDFAILRLAADLKDAHKDIFTLRQHLISITADNNAYSEAMKGDLDVGEMSKADLCQKVAQMQRHTLAALLERSPSSSGQYARIKKIIEITDDNALLKKLRENTRAALLKNYVVYVSGPYALIFALFDKLIYAQAEMEKISHYSFAHYGLDKAFFSGNSLPLHASLQQLSALQNAEVGVLADVSWLDEGANKLLEREEKITKAILTLQGFYRSKARVKVILPENNSASLLQT